MPLTAARPPSLLAALVPLYVLLALIACSGDRAGGPSGPERTVLTPIVVNLTFPALRDYPTVTTLRTRVISLQGADSGRAVGEAALPVSARDGALPASIEVPIPLKGTATFRAQVEVALFGSDAGTGAITAAITAAAAGAAAGTGPAMTALASAVAAEELLWLGQTLPMQLIPGTPTQTGTVLLGRGTVTDLRVDSVVIQEPQRRFMGLRETLALSAAVYATTPGARAYWTTLDPQVATVDSRGVVSAVHSGRARIAAFVGFGSPADTLTLDVFAGFSHLSVAPRDTTLTSIGDTLTMRLFLWDEEGNPSDFRGEIFWTLGLPTLEALPRGRYVARRNGSTTQAVAPVHVPGRWAPFDVQVRQRAVAVAVMPADSRLTGIGTTTTLRARGNDARGNRVDSLAWRWSVTGPASIPAGITADSIEVTVHDTGTVRVTATPSSWHWVTVADGLTGSTSVTAVPRFVAVEVNAERLVLGVLGAMTQLTAVVRDERGRAQPVAVRWTSNDPAVVTVSFNGLVTATGGGRTRIIADAGSLGLADTVEVEVRLPVAAIATHGGDAQAVAAGAALAPLRARVSNASGQPMAGLTVAWATGNGTITATSTTGADGVADATWTPGTTAGAASATATVQGTGLTTTFTATIMPAAATQLVVAMQPSAAASSGMPLVQQPLVRLRDQYGNHATQAGVAVSASLAGAGGGTLGGTTTVDTDATGVATFTDLAISGSAGVRTLAFASAGVTGASSNAIALGAGAAATLVKVTTDINALAGTAHAITARVIDAAGNGVAGVDVAFGVTSGGGRLDAPVATSDASGDATVQWILGAEPGAQSATASVAGLAGSPVPFAATATVGTVARMVFASQPQAIEAGTGFTPAVVVELRDAAGNLVTGASQEVMLTLATNPDSATLVGNTAMAVEGVATFGDMTMDRAGSGYILVAATAGAPSVASAAFDVRAGPVASFDVDVPAGAFGVGAPVTVELVARDAMGNVATGFTGTVAVTSTGALASGGGTSAAFVGGRLTHTVAWAGEGNFTLTVTNTGEWQAGTSRLVQVGGGAP